MKPPGSSAPGGAQDDVPGCEIRGPADDAVGFPVAEIDVDQQQLVGVGMLLERQHLDGADTGDVAPGRVDAFDDETDLVEPVGQFGGLALDGGEVAKPGERGLHCCS